MLIDEIQYTRTFRWVWDQNGGRKQELVTLEIKDFEAIIEEIKDLREKVKTTSDKYYKLRRKNMRYG